ncbi:MAG TPA: stealth conserved region 3 domain-containing protein, partial [Euzebyales bacterium]|nr:stealth conserved region 3 domain-containing protein [Euzebyales bacterium]
MSVLRSVAVSTLKRLNLVEPVLAARNRAGHALDPLRRALAQRTYGPLLTRHDDLLLVRDADAWEVARRDDRLVVRDVMADNLDLVVSALEERAIPCLVVPSTTPYRHRVIVPALHRAAAFEALVRTGDPTLHLYLDNPGLPPRQRRVALGVGLRARARARVLRQPLWRVYAGRSDARGRAVLGHLHGCEVEFWSASDTARGGTRALVAERWNKKVAELPADVMATGTVQVRDRAYPTLAEFEAAPHFDDVTFPVDVVYTWVDGSDPAWLERKNAVLRDLNLAQVHADAHDAARYRSRDELKYSLRSIAMFADFVRHVYIVTDDQVPPWLNTDNSRMTVVSHKDLFAGKGRLPTFNSHAIEACLHHIDGLSEQYLYLNDDFLFCRRVRPETFFLSNGLAKFFPSTALIALDDARSSGVRSVDVAAKNSRALVRRHFDRVVQQKMKHAPYPQRRSVLYEAEETFPEEFERTMSSQVRSPSDLPVASAFSHYYGYLTGRAVPGDVAARYVEL